MENQYKINKIDQREMVLIPEGVAKIGSMTGYAEEQPVHEVMIKSLYFDKYLVTNSDFKVFCDLNDLKYPEDPRWPSMPHYFIDYPDYPVVNVSHQQAQQYAQWAGKRLPTEKEWEYAAAGGFVDVDYPWGNEGVTGNKANFADRNTNFDWRDFTQSDGYEYTSPVGIYPPNNYGLYDMAGNIWQWCDDWFFDYSDKIRDTESFKDGWGGSKIARGGCYHSDANDLRISRRRRLLGGSGNISVGFRCVQDVTTDENQSDEKIDKVPESKTIDLSLLDQMDEKPLKKADHMRFCMGVKDIDKEMASRIKQLGFTSVEQYVTWETVENNGENEWDFSSWDEQVATIKEAGLKWVPFIIAGPAYSLPDWYRKSSNFQGLKCLEHNLESKIQSVWDINFRFYVERFIKRFSEQYRKTNVIEAVLLGITGDFGESIFPDWHGNWTTQIPGLYHSHAGYWCDDQYAKQHFEQRMRDKYESINDLNAAWGTSYKSFCAIKYPELLVDSKEGFRVDEHTNAGHFSPENVKDTVLWLDFVDWYRDSMTEFSDFWISTTRAYFPDDLIYLCTGGNAIPYHGSNFADQCKIAARHDSGIRITNEASVYASNFFVTNWVASAGRFYNSYFGFEPAGKVTEKGITARIFNATATGAEELHFYAGNIFDNFDKIKVLEQNIENLFIGTPKTNIGALYPDTSILLGDTTSVNAGVSFELLRDYTDFRFIDEYTIEDGILEEISILIICCGRRFRKNALEKVREWYERGGVLIIYNVDSIVAAEIDEVQGYPFDLTDANDHMAEQVTKLDNLFVNPILIETNIDSIGVKPLFGKVDIKTKRETQYYQNELFDKITAFLTRKGYPVVDGSLDGVYFSELTDRLIIHNTNDHLIQKNIHMKDNQTKQIEMASNTIVQVIEENR